MTTSARTGTSMKTNNSDHHRDYKREMLRSSLMSLIMAVLKDRKRRNKYTLTDFASAVGRDKAQVSRWLSGSPNWSLNTISDVASALNLDIEIRAHDRAEGIIYSPTGVVQVEEASPEVHIVLVSAHGAAQTKVVMPGVRPKYAC